jgi:thiol:disulfide interchange protein
MRYRVIALVVVHLLCSQITTAVSSDTKVMESSVPAPFRPLHFCEAKKAAEAEQKIVFIDFFTTWCEPCKKLDRTTWKDPEVVKLLA